MNNIKRILIIALCSILCVCTVPRFSLRSEAASTATYALYQTLLNLSGYLTTRGYSIVHEYGSSIPSISDLRNQTQEGLGQTLYSIAQKLDAFGAEHDLPDLGQRVISGAEAASLTGAIIYSKQVRDLLDLYLSTSTVNDSVNVGTIYSSISDYFQSASFGYQIGNYTLSMTCESIPAVIRNNSSYTISLAIPANLDDWSYNALYNSYFIPGVSYQPYMDSYTVSYGGKSYNFPALRISGIPSTNVSFYNFTTSYSNVIDGIAQFFSVYYAGQLDQVERAQIVLNRITDTSSSDLLTSTNSISSDGTLEGDTTIYLPSQSEFEQLIDDYNSQSITYDDFLNALGINSISDSATVEEKEAALEVVVTPSEDYLWFTKTQWGSDTIEETRKASASTRAEEDSLADSIANTANGGSDPEDPDNKSRGKGLLALLLLGLGIWNTPIIAGDGTPSGGGTDDDSGDGSGDTSGYLAESIAGMAVAGSLVDDLFDSAGGSNGYGLIYTVGASFVIFSVIIGAANYFGALFHGSDTKQNIKASGKRSTPGKEKKGG